jgi:ribonuclease HII
MLILGIDDAGRGPVLGNMVLAGALIDKENETKLKELGVKDSKMLTPKRREFLFDKIKKLAVDYEIIQITPYEIDSRGDNGINLNNLEAIKMAEIVNKIIERYGKKKEKIKVIIDCPSNNIKKWQDYFEKYVENKNILDIHAEWKADFNHVIVGAASILAKVTRDEDIKRIKKLVKVDIGSGYPSDPVTIKFLQNYAKKFRKEGIFRESWQTFKDLKGKKEQKKLGEY